MDAANAIVVASAVYILVSFCVIFFCVGLDVGERGALKDRSNEDARFV